MNDELDKLIDDALASYTPLEPRAALSQRILAAVAADRPRTWSWRPLWALAAASVLIAAVAIPLAHKPAQPAVAVLHTQQLIEGNSTTAAATPVRIRQHRSVLITTRSAALGTPGKSGSGGMTLLRIEAIETKPITIAPIQIAALN